MVVAKKTTTVEKVASGKTSAEISISEVSPVLSVAVEEPVVSKIEPVKVVRRKELVERIAAKSGMKPNLIKSVLDAVLLELGDTLSKGETLQVQPLGKMSVNRRKELPDREVLVCKLRRRKEVITPTTEAAE